MHWDEPSSRPAHNARDSMEQLALSAVGALQKAGMADELNGRVFSRPPTELICWEEAKEGDTECRYRPMVELLLLELTAIGRDVTLEPEEQQRRIRWTLDAAGF